MNTEFVTTAEAAEMLGVSIGQVRQFVRLGMLIPDPSSRSSVNRRLFKVAEVSALRELREQGFSMESVLVEARRSSLETRAMRKELDQMKFLLGLTIPNVPVDRDALVSLLLKAEDALREEPTRDKHQLLEWARTLHGINETHFEAITRFTDQEEPWRVFIALGRKLCAAMDPLEARADIELHHIYMLLNAALRRVRECAYFHIRKLYGKKNAEMLVPDVKGCPHDAVIAMSFNQLLWDSPTPGRSNQSKWISGDPASSRGSGG